MQKLDIQLQKRKGKMIIYLIVGIFASSIVIGFAPNVISEFSWWKAAVIGMVLIADIIALKGLIEYFTYGDVKMIAESDGKTISFYNQNSNGKIFNKSSTIDLTKMQKFYVVARRTRYLMTNYSFAFESNSKLSGFLNDPIDAFPTLFEASADQRSSVLQFVKTVYPPIELGYENFFQKMKKK